MNTLVEKINSNRKILLNLNENEVITAGRGKLIEQDDYVQVDNIVDIEYAIYLTFTNLFLLTNNSTYIECDRILKDIDQCIDNIYNNINLSKLIDDEDSFKEMINYIDEEYFSLKSKLFHGSPFFTLFTKIYMITDIAKEIFKENNVYINKMMGIYRDQLEGKHYDISDSDSDSGNESDIDRDGDTKDTGEDNPNLIYDKEE
jgi:hypothetical protein|tara:strand:+ start:2095 stop:2700 length:606 start_codon:yes stop_codon:yes gene_type:complete